MQKYRCAIIGCGGRSIRHGKAYRLVERGELVACCDLLPDARQSYAERFDIKAYADAGEMIDKEKPDLVHLVTWPDTRVELMSLVHELGVPACIVEKPIAREVADWKALNTLERITKTKFAVCHQFRWHQDLSTCREALRSGRLGSLRFLDFTARNNISDQGTHTLDYAMSLNEDSPVVRVFGTASGSEEMESGHPAPVTAEAQVLFANGVTGLWSTGYVSPQAVSDPTTWKHVRVEAYAERGRTLWEEFGRWEVVSPDGMQSGKMNDMDDWGNGNDAAQASMIEGMFDWLEDDRRPAGTNLKQSLHEWNVVQGLYASAVWRKPVEIPFDPPEDLFVQLSKALTNPF
ncbi:MAG: Gfo/Idh/MocA family oxidoreductase [Chloroflexi bacterium]|nr:Gfo/Idh/MocA family oxidoreductase [Chloroflexota bacterium]